MDNTLHFDDLTLLTIDQLCDLATAVREDFGCGLSRVDFTESLLIFLEDVPGFEASQVDARLIESAWAIYSGRPSEL
ncbi:hypothetical protein KPB04_31705 [Burkholderia cenocepacia]|uniref:hypothetical protein n=1 Tax=Burkholderia cenocepacia TaxID=95486 RepID=UPI002860B85D|nr:hypothetical protein [Burkholderia cenocepacia]MDR8106292.1 hypothetical protein [Burkholderia cenocepacia]